MNIKTAFTPKTIAIYVCAAVLVLGYKYYFFNDDEDEYLKRYDPIAPVELADGRVEHVLIDPGFRGDPHKYWVLRFPKEAWISLSGNWSSKVTFEGVTTKFNPIPNVSLSFALKLSDFTIVRPDEHFGSNLKRTLKIQLLSRETEFGGGAYKKRGDGTFLNIRKGNYEINCIKEQEVFPGIFTLRKRTEAEKQALRETFNDPKMRIGESCRGNDPQFPVHAIYDEHNILMAGGYCSRREDGHCSFVFWLPQKRKAGFTFNKRHLKDIHDIYKRVQEIVTELTVEIKTVPSKQG